MREVGFSRLDHCVCCNSKNLEEILDLGSQPLANSYSKFPVSQEQFPLGVNICLDCWHLQLFGSVNPDLLFRNYVYVSGTTKTLGKYFDDFITKVENTYSKESKLNILEIASNDGTLIEALKAKGHSVIGIDPAINLLQHSISKNVITIPCYWDKEIAKHLKSFDLIVAMNVFAHTTGPKEFLINCQDVMNSESTLIIQTSQAEMVELNQFDTIYHEHISFFNVNSFMKIIEDTNLKLVNIERAPIHGTSWVWHLKLKSSQETINPNVQKFVNQERDNLKLHDISTYIEFRRKSIDVAQKVKELSEKYSKDGFALVGFGAAAKGNTFLNYIQLKLDYIVEDNELKWGHYSPGMNIPIKSPEILMNDSRDIAVIVPAWNFLEEITKSISNMRRLGKTVVISYFPEIKIIEI